MDNKTIQSFAIANRLKELRIGRGLSFDKLSAELRERYEINISSDSLANYEINYEHQTKVGKNLGMRVEYLICLADYYGVSTDYLLGKDVPMTPDVSVQEMMRKTGLSEDIILRLIAWNNLESIKESYTENSPTYISSICELTENMSAFMQPEDLRVMIIDFSNCLLASYLNSPGMITRSYLNYMGSLYTWYNALKNNSEDRIYDEAYKTDTQIHEFGLVTLTAKDSAKYSLSNILNMLSDEIDRISQNIVFSAIDK